MDEQFIKDRITHFCLLSGKSERMISIELGHSAGYINGITSGKSLPSLRELMYICEYFQISMEEFFHTEDRMTPAQRELLQAAISVSDTIIRQVTELLKALSQETT